MRSHAWARPFFQRVVSWQAHQCFHHNTFEGSGFVTVTSIGVSKRPSTSAATQTIAANPPATVTTVEVYGTSQSGLPNQQANATAIKSEESVKHARVLGRRISRTLRGCGGTTCTAAIESFFLPTNVFVRRLAEGESVQRRVRHHRGVSLPRLARFQKVVP